MGPAETSGGATGPVVGRQVDVGDLRQILIGVLRNHVPRAEPVALIDWPAHSNVGDAAIWLGEVAALREGGWEVAYACAHDGYDPARIREQIGPGGTVLLHGGGNLGDLYPAHQELRLRVLSDLRDLRVVQLPQTAHFEDKGAIEIAARAFSSHPDFAVLVRDRTSERLMAELGCRTDLCPDSAVALGPLQRTGSPDADVLVIARADRESPQAQAPSSMPGVLVRDWPLRAPAATVAMRAASTRAARRAARHPAAWSIVGPRAARGYERVSRRVLQSGIGLLSRGRVVVSDRLHAHFLCVLLGIPHVLVDDRFGKISSILSAWNDGTPLYDGVDGMTRAIEGARALAR